MKGSFSFVIVACLAAASCERDPARDIKIVSTAPVTVQPEKAPAASPADAPPAAQPAAPVPPAAVPAPAGTPSASLPTTAGPKPRATASAASPAGDPPPPEDGKWRPEGCPPPAERSTGAGNFTASGPCAFQHRSIVSCEAAVDDFILTMSRPAGRGALLMVYINVEKYKGPGTYDGAQMFVGVQGKTSIYRWSSDEVTVTVDPGQKSATLPETKLPSEPVLIDCKGPMLNYQCAGRNLESPINETEEVVSGTLMCGKIGVSDK